MGAVEETRKAIQDFIAPELRTVSARIEALRDEQARLRTEITASETRLTTAIQQTHAEIISTEKRLSTAIEQTHTEIISSEARLRGELIASETRVTAAIDRLRADLPLVVRNAVLEQLLAEKQRVIEDLQRSAH